MVKFPHLDSTCNPAPVQRRRKENESDCAPAGNVLVRRGHAETAGQQFGFITKGSGKERRIEKFLTFLWLFGFSSGKKIVALFLF